MSIAKNSRYCYGSRRVKKTLNLKGYMISRKRNVKLMKEVGVQVRYWKKYKTTTNSNHDRAVFENVLDRQFSISTSDQAYVSDITYIPT